MNPSAQGISGSKVLASPATVLIAEDSRTQAAQLQHHLESNGYRVVAAGLNARLTAATAELVAGTGGHAVDAHAIQPVYTGILARDCGLTLAAATEGESFGFLVLVLFENLEPIDDGADRTDQIVADSRAQKRCQIER